jgi:hypothetical protein
MLVSKYNTAIEKALPFEPSSSSGGRGGGSSDAGLMPYVTSIGQRYFGIRPARDEYGAGGGGLASLMAQMMGGGGGMGGMGGGMPPFPGLMGGGRR